MSKFFGKTYRGLSEKDIKKLVKLVMKEKTSCSSGFTLKRYSTSIDFYVKPTMDILGQYLRYSKSCWAVIKDGYLILDFEMKISRVCGDYYNIGDKAQLKIYLELVEKDYFERKWSMSYDFNELWKALGKPQLQQICGRECGGIYWEWVFKYPCYVDRRYRIAFPTKESMPCIPELEDVIREALEEHAIVIDDGYKDAIPF